VPRRLRNNGALVLDGVYRRTEGEPNFEEVRAPTSDELQGLLDKITARLMKMLTRLGHQIEEQDVSYRADIYLDNPERQLKRNGLSIMEKLRCLLWVAKPA
jgi:hypothetical protein